MRKGSILCVDDEEAVLQTLEAMLSKLGYQVIVSGNSTEALQIFKQQHHAIILVIADIVMPEITGSVLAKQLHSIAPAMPIILTTGYADLIMTDLTEGAIAIGVKRIVGKPFTRSELHEAIIQVLHEE